MASSLSAPFRSLAHRDFIQENGVAAQDICLVRPCEDASKASGTIECLVWGKEYSADYTDKFVITQYKEDE